jgi:hypothetical protein
LPGERGEAVSLEVTKSMCRLVATSLSLLRVARRLKEAIMSLVVGATPEEEDGELPLEGKVMPARA